MKTRDMIGTNPSPARPNVARPDVPRTDVMRQDVSKLEGDARLGEKGEVAIPVVKEELHVGKREVQGGGVHVERRVVEQPVEQSVSLREEHVRVERRPVDRVATPGDLTGFREGGFDVVERSEQAVVQKTARVVEEVVIGKEATQRTERVAETLRHTEVSVRDLGGLHQGASVRRYEDYDTDFRSNFSSLDATKFGKYEDFSPAYRYGYDLATAKDYYGRDWPTFETEARDRWETHNPGTWERVKDGVRFAWAKVTGRALASRLGRPKAAPFGARRPRRSMASRRSGPGGRDSLRAPQSPEARPLGRGAIAPEREGGPVDAAVQARVEVRAGRARRFVEALGHVAHLVRNQEEPRALVVPAVAVARRGRRGGGAACAGALGKEVRHLVREGVDEQPGRPAVPLGDAAGANRDVRADLGRRYGFRSNAQPLACVLRVDEHVERGRLALEQPRDDRIAALEQFAVGRLEPALVADALSELGVVERRAHRRERPPQPPPVGPARLVEPHPKRRPRPRYVLRAPGPRRFEAHVTQRAFAPRGRHAQGEARRPHALHQRPLLARGPGLRATPASPPETTARPARGVSALARQSARHPKRTPTTLPEPTLVSRGAL